MKGLCNISQEISRRRNPVSKSADWNTIPFNLLPISYVAYPPATSESFKQNLREKVEIAYQS